MTLKIPVTVLCCDTVQSDTWIPSCTVSQHRSQYELAGYTFKQSATASTFSVLMFEI